jgi:acyl carrier protein
MGVAAQDAVRAENFYRGRLAMHNIANRVKSIVVEHLSIDAEAVTLNASFVEDLGVNSLDAAVLVMAFEEEFNCEISDSASEAFITVLDVIRFFQDKSKKICSYNAQDTQNSGAIHGVSQNSGVSSVIFPGKASPDKRVPWPPTPTPMLDLLVQDLADAIEWDRMEFIARVESSLDCYVSGVSLIDCLMIVEQGSGRGAVKTYRPVPPDLKYIKALLAFLRQAKYKGHRLNSGLTDPTVSIVVVELERFFFERSEMISEQISQGLVQDKAFVHSICAQVVDANSGTIPRAMREQVIGLLMGKVETGLRRQINSSALTGVKNALSQAFVTAGGAAVSAQITALIARFLALNSPSIAARLVCNAVRETTALTRAKIAGGFVAAGVAAWAAGYWGGVGLGGGWGRVLWLFLIPAAGALAVVQLARRAKRTPKQLGREVSIRIGEELSANFRETTIGVLETAVDQMASRGVSFVTTELYNEMDKGQFTRDLFETARKQCAE